MPFDEPSVLRTARGDFDLQWVVFHTWISLATFWSLAVRYHVKMLTLVLDRLS